MPSRFAYFKGYVVLALIAYSGMAVGLWLGAVGGLQSKGAVVAAFSLITVLLATSIGIASRNRHRPK